MSISYPPRVNRNRGARGEHKAGTAGMGKDYEQLLTRDTIFFFTKRLWRKHFDNNKRYIKEKRNHIKKESYYIKGKQIYIRRKSNYIRKKKKIYHGKVNLY